MGNIVTYIHEEQRTFSEVPFNAVDSLICSTICYFDFDHSAFPLAAEGNLTLIHDVVAMSDWTLLAQGSWLQDTKDTHAFMAALMASRRYRSLAAAYYANEFSNFVEKQFCAMTFDLGNGMLYLAFRGTDGSFAGWKEDFNLCFKHVIPSQRSAAAYLSGVASATTKPLIVGGHSKGGNLAEYAALVCDDCVFDRIEKTYNHDGPSFLDDPSPRVDSPAFEEKLQKTVPESSAFGMILERRSGYTVVQSSALSVFQHNPFTWRVENGAFICQEELNKSALFFDGALDAWLRSKTAEERERFIDTLYDLFVSTEASSWPEFQKKLLTNTRKMVSVGGKLDPETKKFILSTIASLGRILRQESLKRLKPYPLEWAFQRREQYRQTKRIDDIRSNTEGR